MIPSFIRRNIILPWGLNKKTRAGNQLGREPAAFVRRLTVSFSKNPVYATSAKHTYQFTYNFTPVEANRHLLSFFFSSVVRIRARFFFVSQRMRLD